MKRIRYTDERIIGILREAENGEVPAISVCRKHGISEQAFYRWKAKYGGMEVSEAKPLKALEDENGRLKKLLADAMLDKCTGPRLSRHRVEAYAASAGGLV